MTATDGASATEVDSAALHTRLELSPAWLRARREQAWDAFTTLPMPARSRDEDWRRTDLSALHLDAYDLGVPAAGGAGPLLDALRRQRDAAAPDAVFAAADGSGLAIAEDDHALRAQGVTVSSLEAAAVDTPEPVGRALETLAIDEAKFAAMWSALWSGGCFVHVPRGVAAAVPLWVAHALTASATAAFPATVIVLEEGASLTLVESLASPGDERTLLCNAVTLAVLGRGARLDYCALQALGPGAFHMATQRATLDADARLRFFGATLGSRLQKAYWEAVLAGRGAEASIVGVAFGNGRQHIDHQSLQAHRAPDTRSDLLLKVAVRDQARSVYSGLIDVEREAQRTDGYVQNRNLILSRGAKADSIPRLEIKANDVRCSHGTAVGHIDAEQSFYLQSRGVDREEAERIIVRGFMEDALSRCAHQGFAGLVGGLLDEEIGGRDVAGSAA